MPPNQWGHRDPIPVDPFEALVLPEQTRLLRTVVRLDREASVLQEKTIGTHRGMLCAVRLDVPADCAA